LKIPRDYEELVNSYGRVVSAAAKRYLCAGETEEDLLQKIWMRLLEARLLEKYHNCSAFVVQKSFTRDQAQRVFSVSESDWRECELAHKKFLDLKYHLFVARSRGMFWGADGLLVSWMPTPVNGQYKVEDLFELDELGIFGRKPLVWPAQEENPQHFIGYLMTAVCNFGRNHVRDMGRHLKERTACAFGKHGNRLYDEGTDSYDFDRLESDLPAADDLLVALGNSRIRAAMGMPLGQPLVRSHPACRQ
jgi:hypothetical protein